MNTFPNRLHRSASPLGGLSGMFFREMNDLLRAQESASRENRGVYPPVNRDESDEGYVLTAELPGVSPDDIDVTIEGSTLTLAGQRKVEYAAGEGTSVHRRERPSGHFRRAFELPTEIDTEHAKASHRNGVLTLTLPKSPTLRPRQIQIETR
jgi:HSP20 family protein